MPATDTKVPRAPIVAVLGHVDHGKTTLLDKVRKTDVAASEVGGITQQIGAYQVEYAGKKITFIDTPGHEAFAAMRSRGARVADIVVLVVAADDGVMPQTREALSHIKEADVPFLVTITKIDLPSAQVERVKNQLSDAGVALEGRGGDVVAVSVSGKTGEGIDELLEMINLLSQLHEVSANPEGKLSGVVIETKKDRRGPVATVLVREGTLRVGDEIQAERVVGRARGLFDENKRPKKEALPGEPVEVIGFDEPPLVGTVVTKRGEEIVLKEKEARQKTLPDSFLVILKADTQGTLEAISHFLGSGVGVLESGVGDVSESDVLLASTTGATIIGFNVSLLPQVKKLAEEEKVPVITGNIIYELKREVEELISGKVEAPPEQILGRAEITAEFPYGKTGKIAGMRVVEGRVAKGDLLTFQRQDEVIGANLRITSMKQQNNDISKAEKGDEFGAVFSGKIDFAVGDVVVSKKPSTARASEDKPAR